MGGHRHCTWYPEFDENIASIYLLESIQLFLLESFESRPHSAAFRNKIPGRTGGSITNRSARRWGAPPPPTFDGSIIPVVSSTRTANSKVPGFIYFCHLHSSYVRNPYIDLWWSYPSGTDNNIRKANESSAASTTDLRQRIQQCLVDPHHGFNM